MFVGLDGLRVFLVFVLEDFTGFLDLRFLVMGVEQLATLFCGLLWR